jgi:hypothetical protein
MTSLARHAGVLSRAALVLLLSAAASISVHGDQTATTNGVREAERLRDAGQLAKAADLLRAHLARQPDDGEAARVLAQTLYWLHDVAGARSVYVASISRHPDDTALRLQFGRMLLETRAWSEARAILTPLRNRAATRTEATALLGTLAYWEGDLTAARRLFVEVLTAQPTHAEARRQLEEIDSVSAPWIRVSAGVRHDDQPLDRLSGGVEAGWYATPLVPIAIRTEPLAFRDDVSTVTRLWSTEASVRGYAPRSRVEFDVGGGVLTRPNQATAEGWVAHAGLGVRVAPTVALRGRVERRPYLNTPTSISTPVRVRAVQGLVAWTDPRGWLAEAAVEQQYYEDSNSVISSYAWLLAPVVHRARGDFQVGYAFGYADARESRFVLARVVQPVPRTDPRFDFAGEYVPYFTPDDQRTHSLVVAGAVRGGSGAHVTLNASLPIHATEQAPQLSLVNGQLTRTSFERTYSPWTVRASAAVPLASRVTLGFSGDIGRTAFYEWAGGDVQLTIKLRRHTREQP